MNYTIRQREDVPAINDWEHGHWHDVQPLQIASFRPESSKHRPFTELKLQYVGKSLFGMFRVRDQYVRCVNRGFQTQVCRDSCVECFIKPVPDKGYFNFEFNCGGALLCYYVADHRRTMWGFRKYLKLHDEELKQISIYHSLPEVIDPEIEHETTWYLGFRIPIEIMETYVGPLETLSGKQWTANFYKCGDDTSHPHWASWKPVSKLNFHLPDCFGDLHFE